VIKNIQFTLAIAPMLPVGPFICLLGLLVIYWCDKWLVLRRMVCKNYLSQKLSKKMLKRLRWTTVYFAVGSFFTKILPFVDAKDKDNL
jgi:hypothetical protein